MESSVMEFKNDIISIKSRKEDLAKIGLNKDIIKKWLKKKPKILGHKNISGDPALRKVLVESYKSIMEVREDERGGTSSAFTSPTRAYLWGCIEEAAEELFSRQFLCESMADSFDIEILSDYCKLCDNIDNFQYPAKRIEKDADQYYDISCEKIRLTAEGKAADMSNAALQPVNIEIGGDEVIIEAKKGYELFILFIQNKIRIYCGLRGGE